MGPTQTPVHWVQGPFPCSKAAVTLTTHPNLALTSKKEQSYTSTSPLGLHDHHVFHVISSFLIAQKEVL